MNACPNDGFLLQFLDGELNAGDDARVLAHVEDCVPCQDRLERLTAGRPATGDEPPIETVQTDSDPTADLLPTEIVERDVGHSGTSGEVRERESTGTWEKSSGVNEVDGPGATAEFSGSPASSQAVSTRELNDADSLETDDPDRTASASGGDPETQAVRRKPAPVDSPNIPGYDILQRLGEGGMGVV